MELLTNNGKKNPFLLMTLINRFERSCGTFRGRGGKNPLSSTTLGLACSKIIIFKFKKNIYIYIYIFENNDILNHSHEIHL
jgi:hypothetical protein